MTALTVHLQELSRLLSLDWMGDPCPLQNAPNPDHSVAHVRAPLTVTRVYASPVRMAPSVAMYAMAIAHRIGNVKHWTPAAPIVHWYAYRNTFIYAVHVSQTKTAWTPIMTAETFVITMARKAISVALRVRVTRIVLSNFNAQCNKQSPV